MNPSRRSLLLSLALLVMTLPVTRSRAAEPTVEVSSDQTATVVGTFDSLRALIENLCTKAEIELRAYGAPDRPVTASYSATPLNDLLERILSQESYLLGVREDEAPGAHMRVAWLSVTGAKHADAAATAGGPAVPSRPGARDLQREDTTDSLRTHEAVAARLLGDDAQVAKFLKEEPSELARSLSQYPHIDVLLRKLRAEQEHPAVVEKLDAVIRELAASTPANTK